MTTPTLTCPCCGSLKATVKKYVGSTDTYNYCPACMHTWGGEETPAKKALLRDACRAEVTEQDEVEGTV
jgi:hypothetical protein